MSARELAVQALIVVALIGIMAVIVLLAYEHAQERWAATAIEPAIYEYPEIPECDGDIWDCITYKGKEIETDN